MDFDLVIRNGTVVDGTGAPAARGDVAVVGDRIAAVGEVDGTGREEIDADGLVVAPGFIDVHTHYDAQLHWDPYATPSSNHGVTSVIGGNCGFTLAPLKQRDADYTRRMMAQVEGMSLLALETGLSWEWETFGEFLDVLDGAIAVNAGFMVGHCALRRYVLGEESLERAATEAEVDAMTALLHESLRAGGLGLSTTRSRTHPDHDGRPVPSRQSSEEELLTLCDAVGAHPGTTLEAITSGCIGGFDDGEIELLAQMSAHANRPLNWNLLSVQPAERASEGARTPREHLARQMLPAARAREIGARVVALTMPIGAELNMSMATYCGMWLIPGWREIMMLPLPEKTVKLRDPAVRSSMVAAARGTGLEHLADVAGFEIGDTLAPENAQYEGRTVRDIAAERRLDPWDALLDIEEADAYQTVLVPQPAANSDADWQLRREVWDLDDVLLGGSDAGAHLDRLLGASYPTRFLGDTIRGRQLIPLERAVQLITDAPARLYGLKGRGRLVEGAHADVVVFDPSSIGSGRAHRVHDLPGASLRLTADSIGIERVIVNGVVTIRSGEPTSAVSGTLLRSGRDTATVTTR